MYIQDIASLHSSQAPSFVRTLEPYRRGAISPSVAAEMGHPERLATGEPKALAAGVPASLGIYAKSLNPPPPENAIFRRAERFAMQKVSASFLRGQRVCKCLRVPTTDHVKITHNKAQSSYGYRNLETCSSVWMCPVCGAKISEKRRSELELGITNWKAKFGSVALLTFTVQHNRRDTFEKSLKGLSVAYGKLLNRKTGKRLLSAMGVRGRIRSLEATYGENGWHPHFHILLFLERSLSADMLKQFEEVASSLWLEACLSAGLNATNNHGCTLHDGTYAAQYVAKWGIEHEMTKGHSKKSKTGYSPFDLLRVNLGTYTGEAAPLAPGQHKELFKEYAYCMKGKRQLVWSDGLRDLLGLSPEKTDEELVNEVEEQEIEFVRIPLRMWRVILKQEQRAQVLESCKIGDTEEQRLESFYLCCKKIWLDYERGKL